MAHTCMHTQRVVHIQSGTHTHAHAHKHKHTHHTRTNAHTHTHTHTHTNTCTHTCTPTPTHAHMHTHTNIDFADKSNFKKPDTHLVLKLILKHYHYTLVLTASGLPSSASDFEVLGLRLFYGNYGDNLSCGFLNQSW